MITVTLNNTGGPIAERKVEAPVDVVDAIIQMVTEAGEMFPGDSIVVSEDDEGE